MTLQVGVKVVLKNEEGNILVLQRSERYGNLAGVWDIPGGRIDPTQSLMENLAREVKEETGLTISGTPRLISAQDLMPREGKEQHVVRLTYVGETQGTPILDGVEHTEYKFISFAEFAELEELDSYVQGLIQERALTDASWAPTMLG